MRPRCQRIQLVNNLEARFFAEIVDAGDIDQVIERQLVAANPRDFSQILSSNDESRFAAEFDFALQFVAKSFAQRCNKIGANHAVTASSFSAGLRFCERKEDSPEIFS